MNPAPNSTPEEEVGKQPKPKRSHGRPHQHTLNTSQILVAYANIEENEPNISTERLLQMTADQCRCDVSDVCDALYKQSPSKNKRPSKPIA